jgi:hypothetical protein
MVPPAYEAAFVSRNAHESDAFFWGRDGKIGQLNRTCKRILTVENADKLF